eukprot:199721-Prymnesium_polylepis.1
MQPLECLGAEAMARMDWTGAGLALVVEAGGMSIAGCSCRRPPSASPEAAPKRALGTQASA